MAIPSLIIPALAGSVGIAYGVFTFMGIAVLISLILAIRVSMRSPETSRDSFKSAFRRALKVSLLAFALVFGVVESLYRSELGYSGVLGRALGQTLVGALLGVGSLLLGFWLLLLVKRLPLRTEFSKDIIYGISGSILGAFILGPILDIPFITGLILVVFSLVVVSSVITGVRKLFGLSRNHGS